MRLDLHVGPHRTASTAIQWGAFRNRELLARRGIVLLNDAAQSNALAGAMAAGNAEAALREFDRLEKAAVEALGAPAAGACALYSSEVFFEADRRRAPAVERAFARLAEGLRERGHDLRVVFVDRPVEDILVSNALLQVSLGNLQHLSSSLAAFDEYLANFVWLKGLLFERFEVAHLSFANAVAGGDAFRGFVGLLYGAALDEGLPPDEETDRNGVTDAQLARGLLLAPMLNWIEAFGSVSRFQMVNAAPGLEPPFSPGAVQAMRSRMGLVRSFLRLQARRALERFAAPAGGL